ncbi:MAG: LPS-assembly protein LptD [Cellvibrio sp.]|jgi:Organic solvent tolerance protein OstA
MAVATRTSILFRPSLLAAALTELRRQLRPASAMVLALGLMSNPALADDSSQKKTESGRSLDWVPMEQLTEAQKAAMPKGCCGAYVSPERTDADANVEPANASVRATADSSETQGQTTVIMTGDVQLTQGYRSLNADRATFNQATRRAEIAGDIQIREPGMLLHAEQAEMHIDSGDATLENAEFVLYESRIRGTAESLQKFGNNIIVLTGSRFTSCEPDSNLWSVAGTEVKINQERRYGTARHMRVNIKDIPVLYSPYLRFPVGKDRLTGFLFPSLSFDSDTIIEDFSLPFYWNMAPNYDMLITPRYVDRHGTGIDTEFRHMSAQFDTILSGAFLGDDEGDYTTRDLDRIEQGLRADYTGKDRWIYSVDQTGGRGQRWSTTIDYTELSDIDYLRDFNRSGIDTNRQPNIAKVATASYRTDNWLMSAKAQEFRVLVAESQIPYRELPRINADGSYRLGDWLLELNHEYVNFDLNSFYELDTTNTLLGERLRTDYGLTWDKEFAWGFFKPGVAVKTLNYQLDSAALNETANKSPSLTVPQGSLDMGLFFERDARLFNNSFIQTLEPRVFYFYSDYEDHSELYNLTANNRFINFDTSELTFTYGQLFRESRFSGGDRIDDANQVAVGLSSALISSESGIERLRMSIGQIYYQKDRRVIVPGRVNEDEDKYSRRDSELAGQISGQIGDSLRFQGDVAYDHKHAHLTSASASLNYMDDAYRIFNLSYRYTRNPQMINPSNPNPILESTMDQLDASMIWPVGDQWSLIARSNYDFTYNLELDTFAGLEYNDCCYRIRLLGRRWLNFDYNPNFLKTATQDDYDQGFFVDIQLKGLGSISERISRLLDKAIIGYTAREESMR